MFGIIVGMSQRRPKNQRSVSTVETTVAAQPNVAALGKILEAFQVLTAAATPEIPAQASNSVVTASAAEVVDALLQRMYRRMPKSGTKDSPAESCPYTGLNRSALYELFSLRNENGSPVIKTVSMREENEKHGARYYSVGSVLNYLDRLASEQSSECPTKEDHGEHS